MNGLCGEERHRFNSGDNGKMGLASVRTTEQGRGPRCAFGDLLWFLVGGGNNLRVNVEGRLNPSAETARTPAFKEESEAAWQVAQKSRRLESSLEHRVDHP